MCNAGLLFFFLTLGKKMERGEIDIRLQWILNIDKLLLKIFEEIF